MRNLFLSVALTLATICQAQNILRVNPLVITDEKEVTASLELVNEDMFTAIQCDIFLPDGLALGKPTFSPERTSNNRHTMVVGHIANGAWRIIVYSLNKYEFIGHNGTLINLPLVINNPLPVGTYTIKVVNSVLATKEVTQVKPEDTVTELIVGTPSTKSYATDIKEIKAEDTETYSVNEHIIIKENKKMLVK